MRLTSLPNCSPPDHSRLSSNVRDDLHSEGSSVSFLRPGLVEISSMPHVRCLSVSLRRPCTSVVHVCGPFAANEEALRFDYHRLSTDCLVEYRTVCAPGSFVYHASTFVVRETLN